MVELRFDSRDIFRSTRIAFSFQRIWIQFFGLLLGLVGYFVFTYLALISNGQSFSSIWGDYGLFPGVIGQSIRWYSWILYGIGVFIFAFFWLVAATGVARATYMHLKGNTFYTWKEAFHFALKRKVGSLISTPLTIVIIAVFTGLGGVLVGLIGQIPYVGELGVTLLTVLWFMGALFLVFVLLALVISLFLLPAILATTDDDAFEGIFQSFSTLYTQPWRFIFYEVLIGILSILGLIIFAYIAKFAWNLMSQILSWGMGEDYGKLTFQALWLFKESIHQVADWLIGVLDDISLWINNLLKTKLQLSKSLLFTEAPHICCFLWCSHIQCGEYH
jgi:hypothetical protein